MKTFIITCLLIAVTTINAQTIKLDASLLSKTNWVQADDSPTGLDTPQDAKYNNYSSNKLAFYKAGQWGSLLNNKNQFIVGAWKIQDNQIILYDLYANGKGFNCEIIELTKDGMTISYIDLYKTQRKIKLIPA